MNSLRILVVDDERPLCGVLAELFEMEGFEVAVCHDIESAARELAESRFDVALVDVFLTDEPVGLKLGERILSDFPETSLLLMTGFAREDDIEYGILSGAHACIRKPFELDDALRVVGVALNKKAGKLEVGSM